MSKPLLDDLLEATDNLMRFMLYTGHYFDALHIERFRELADRVVRLAGAAGYHKLLPQRDPALGVPPDEYEGGMINLPGQQLDAGRFDPMPDFGWRAQMGIFRDAVAAASLTPDAASEAGTPSESSAAAEPDRKKPTPAEIQKPTGMKWEAAAERLNRLRSSGEKWTSQRKMGRRIGCSISTINRAIKETPSLQEWATPIAGGPKAQSMNAVVLDRTRQSTELHPEDDAAIREFIEKCKDPTLLAAFHEMSTEAKLVYLDDDDKHPQIRGRRP